MGHCVQLALRKKPGIRSVGIPMMLLCLVFSTVKTKTCFLFKQFTILLYSYNSAEAHFHMFRYLKLPGSAALASSWRLVSRILLSESLFHISVLFLTGTFGQIFQGALLDEKDPSKEKQVFVKTVKGMDSILFIIVILICFVTHVCVILNVSGP